MVNNHHVGGLVAQPMWRIGLPWRSGVRPPWTLKQTFIQQPNKGCHVAPYYSPNKIPCVTQSFDHLYLPNHHLSTSAACPISATCRTDLATSTHSMCHLCSGAMCHNMTHPPVNLLVGLVSATVPATSLYGRTTCTVSCHVNTVWTVQSSNFACLAKWTNHDIFRIRRLFEPIRVVFGLYRRGLRTRLFWSHSEHFDF
jgi:hypothetical protein